MLRKLTLLVSFFVFTSCCLAKSVAQPERINSFVSHISVNPDSTLEVTENISAFAYQNKIRRALVRRLPMNYMDSYGIRHKTAYRIHHVYVNNAPASYSTKIVDNTFIIYIGDPNTLLRPGNYSYEIKYRVHDATNFLPNQDELYWNITGNTWDVPVNKVQATIQLPEGANFIKYTAYTGKVGKTDNDFSISLPAPNQIVFMTTKPLLPKQRLAISISWPKGFVHPATHVQKLAWKVRDSHIDLFMFMGSLILLFLYLLLRPRIFKKD